MLVETQIKIRNNPYLYRYLRDNSSWYKALNRDPNSIKQMEIEMKNAYKLNLTDSIFAIALGHAIGGIPFALMMMKSYIITLVINIYF